MESIGIIKKLVMKISSFIRRTFRNLTLIYFAVNLIVLSFSLYHFIYLNIKIISQDARELLNKEKSYLMYNFLNDSNSPEARDTINRINQDLKIIEISKLNNHTQFEIDLFDLIPYKLSFAQEELATFYFNIIYKNLNYGPVVAILLAYLLVAFLIYRIVIVRLIDYLKENIQSPLDSLDIYFSKHLMNESVDSFPESSGFIELDASLKNIKTELSNYYTIKKNYLRDQEKALIGKLATQVSHDIQSPLATLDSLVDSLNGELDDDRLTLLRLSIDRIKTITMDLKGKTVEDVYPLDLDLIIRKSLKEKGWEFKNISFEYNALTKDCFSKASSIELRRILSNIINNSIEACSIDNHWIKISLFNDSRFNVIVIQDNGHGIKDSSLSKIFEEGYSTRKENSGLGLSHAKKYIDYLGGKIKVESTLNIGTTITIKLKRVKKPSYFTSTVKLKKNIYIIDDDPSVHKLWASKISSFTSFVKPEDFLAELPTINKNNSTFIVDYHFSNSHLTGLDIAKRLEGGSIYLLSSSSESKELVSYASKKPIFLMDKLYINDFLIDFEPNESLYDLVLIDDDDLCRLSWQVKAKNLGKNILLCRNYDELREKINIIPKNIPIFLDSLENERVSGDLITKKLYAMGFINLYYASGFTDEDYNFPEVIKGNVGKSFPESYIIS